MPRASALHPFRTPCGSVTAALLVAAAGACLPAFAGQAGTAFRVTITVVPEAAGSCSASAESGAPQVTCRPTVVGVRGNGGRGPGNDGSPVVGWRPDAPLRLAGEFVEIGLENHYAWTEGSHLAWGEYSSRRVAAGGFEYLEMTLSW